MKVVSTGLHLGHDVTHETVAGVAVPANEVAECALGRRLVIRHEGGDRRPSLGENARARLRGAEGRDDDPRPASGFDVPSLT